MYFDPMNENAVALSALFMDLTWKRNGNVYESNGTLDRETMNDLHYDEGGNNFAQMLSLRTAQNKTDLDSLCAPGATLVMNAQRADAFVQMLASEDHQIRIAPAPSRRL